MSESNLNGDLEKMNQALVDNFQKVTVDFNPINFINEDLEEDQEEAQNQVINTIPKVKGLNGGESKAMEAWLNKTLSEAENLEIPGMLIKPSHKKPLTRYGIDRQQLINAKIPYQDTERIFRSLFVYSLGFYEMLDKIFSHCEYKTSILGNVWRVFALLLEFCCKTNYQTMI